ncbi:hypothetical protein BJP36_05955 [Moorena producens JHB]|uniref:Uncharacterized protein n=1 Tax=Moorena producens (strain JHB) TaxID=1454205 RepID=A0A1D9FVZ6_MOOP1|nr:hypothetical protein [Moorena producens]AOY79527.2 hypothetical protein BJP36_05955 [Moorena producens JHB]
MLTYISPAASVMASNPSPSRKAHLKALSYMMANPNQLRPSFGLVTNGTNFRFLKLTKSGRPMYALSDEFTIHRGNDWYYVLRILKRIAQLV